MHGCYKEFVDEDMVVKTQKEFMDQRHANNQCINQTESSGYEINTAILLLDNHNFLVSVNW